MIVIADSGATQCTWLFDREGSVTRLRTPGINAAHLTPDEVRTTLDALPPLAPDEAVEAVYFYGAGCGASFPEASGRLRRALEERFASRRVVVDSDLRAALLALWGRGEGIACILGTGANSCHCRAGEIVHHVPPLGYILGDEGSGAVLGRNLLNGILKGAIPLRRELFDAYGMTYEQIIARVYRAPQANRFLASFAPFIREHLAVPEVGEMVTASFREFARRNLVHYPAGLGVSLVGGIAAHFDAPLRRALADEGFRVVKIEESPAEGLLKYHHGE